MTQVGEQTLRASPGLDDKFVMNRCSTSTRKAKRDALLLCWTRFALQVQESSAADKIDLHSKSYIEASLGS